MGIRILLVLVLTAAPLAAQNKTEKRLTGLEKRVTKVEKRVTRLEGGTPPPAAAVKSAPAEPVAIYFLKKQQVMGQEKVGLRLYVEFENVSNRRLFAFNGTVVFRNEKGAVIWTKAYGHSEPLASGEKVQVSFGILTDRPKAYLALVRAAKITAEFRKQEAYGLE
ncbi:MAG: hypothetical protein ACYC2I_10900 [Elusimicrobiales bacterium]